MFASYLLVPLLLTIATALPYGGGDDDDDGTCNAPLNFAYTLQVQHDWHNRHHNTAHSLGGKKIEASALGFYIGLDAPATYCPSPPVPIEACPAGNETVLSGLASMASLLFDFLKTR
jgi:hypothetical protein